MTDDQFDQLMRDAAVSYHAPPEPPLDEIWRDVERVRFGVARRSAIRRWLPLAAVFVGGIALGHAWNWRQGVPSAAVATTVVPASAQLTPAAQHDEVATGQYLGQTTALLIALPTELHQAHTDSSFVTRANDLLLTTRLMLDSPSASDPALRGLFQDLELVLAQIVRLQHDRSPSEIDLLNEALEQRDVIPRLRTAVVAHTAE